MVKIAHVYRVRGPLLVLSQAGLQTILKHMHACKGKQVIHEPEAALAVLGCSISLWPFGMQEGGQRFVGPAHGNLRK